VVVDRFKDAYQRTAEGGLAASGEGKDSEVRIQSFKVSRFSKLRGAGSAFLAASLIFAENGRMWGTIEGRAGMRATSQISRERQLTLNPFHVNNGYGYAGRGYQGGYWHGNDFNYNRSVNNISNTNITNVYNRTVVNETTINRVSYNGGPQGVQARPTAAEVAAFRAPHAPPMAAQTQLAKAASGNRAQFASVNNGKPAMMAATKPVPADKGITPAPVMRPVAKNEVRPGSTMQPASAATPAPESKLAPTRPAAEPKPEVNKPAAKAETPTRPAAQAYPESRPATGKPVTEAKPAPQPATPQAHAAPEAHPAPQAHTAPAPQVHTAPQHEQSQPEPKKENGKN
jgi:hypothetical protein